MKTWRRTVEAATVVLAAMILVAGCEEMGPSHTGEASAGAYGAIPEFLVGTQWRFVVSSSDCTGGSPFRHGIGVDFGAAGSSSPSSDPTLPSASGDLRTKTLPPRGRTAVPGLRPRLYG